MTKAPGLLLAGAVALLGLASPAVGRAENPSKAGTVTAVAGPVTVARQSANPQPLRFRDSLFWRDVVEARKDGIARVLLAGKTTVTVRELSRLELRQEVMAEGIRYTAELVSGKVRASVARMLMRPGDQMEIRTKNAVASVRGTDFIVETVALPSQARAFGLLGVLQVAQAVDGGSQSSETVVVTLSGEVDVSNRLAGTGRVERVRAYEAVRVSGRQDPLRFQLSTDDLRVLLQGLTPPRPQEARSGDKSDAVGNKVEGVALATSARSVRVFEQAGGDGRSNRSGHQDDEGGQGGGGSGGYGYQGSGPGAGSSGYGQGSGQSGGQGSGEGSHQGSSEGSGKGDGSPLGQSTNSGSGSQNSGSGSNNSGSGSGGSAAAGANNSGSGSGKGAAVGQSNSSGSASGKPVATPASAATPAVPATPIPAIPATPATPGISPATPATPAMPAAAAVPATPAAPAAGAAPATPAPPAVAAGPAAPAAPAAANPGVGQAVGKPATPPGQAKK